jgi:flagellar hook-basal body complex protein FliE
MSTEAIAALAANVSAAGVSTATTLSLSGAPTPAIQSATANAPTFDSLMSGMQELSAQMHNNSQALEALALGDADGLHRVIMNLERTKLRFDLALQVRNKVLEAYQELMRMQV